MDASKTICHECAFVDSLVTNLKAISKCTAESGDIVDTTDGLTDDPLSYGHLIIPYRHWDHGKLLVYWLGAVHVGIHGNEILNFGDNFVFPCFAGAKVKENPTG